MESSVVARPAVPSAAASPVPSAAVTASAPPTVPSAAASATPAAAVPVPPAAVLAARTLRDDAAPELPRGDREHQVAVVAGHLPALGALAARAVEVPVPALEEAPALAAQGLDDPEEPLCGRELEGRLRLDDLRPHDVPEAEHVVNVLRVLLGYVRDVDRALRLPADLPGPPVDRGHRRGRHHPADVVHDPVHDVADLELCDGVEGLHAGHPRVRG